MQIELSEEMDIFVREQVGDGRFENASALVETALRIMRDRSEKRNAVRRAILEGESFEPPALRF